ncbi:hypothetical protein Deipe_0169 [Deinococcus peraridilitoris DSM 19664]|uniref:Uncharacterized protein n=1 Tax=Deinococcus peraridilitoris (strain DSM 19664 / LMG 22246 / CIP 109416 / KR-200) TaxID=937777 RepID=K9ZVW9_DEIPD|nr:hypothetical protein Deipe_0169 [Deinococcus peraridilitoris DSM 19664]
MVVWCIPSIEQTSQRTSTSEEPAQWALPWLPDQGRGPAVAPLRMETPFPVKHVPPLAQESDNRDTRAARSSTLKFLRTP